MAAIDTQNELSRCNSFVSSPSVLSDNEIEIESCCHLYAAQTNSRLLHVLSDLVKAFLDTEQDIQESLEKMGFSYQTADTVNTDFLPSFEDAIERLSSSAVNATTTASTTTTVADTTLTDNEDVIEFTAENQNNVNTVANTNAAASTAVNLSNFSSTVNGQLAAVNNEDDILLGASRRLRSAVGKILHLLQKIVNTHKNQEKFLFKTLQREEKFGEDESDNDKSIELLKETNLNHSNNIINENNILNNNNNENYLHLQQIRDEHNTSYRDTEDLIAQIESSSKQISSFNKFIEQQAKEREFERDEFTKEIEKFKQKLKEKEKLELKLKDIIETNDLQMQALIDERNDFEKKFNEKTLELKRSMKIIDDYKQTLKRMEKESEELATIEMKLTKRINELEEAITLQASINEQLHKEQLNSSNSLASAVIESINLRTSQLQRTLNIGDMLDMDDYSASLISNSLADEKQQLQQENEKSNEKFNQKSVFIEDESAIECSYADVNVLDEKMRLLNTYMEKLISQNIKLKSNLEYSNSCINDLESKINNLQEEKCSNENRIRDLQKQEELLREELNSKRLQLSSLKTKVENNFDENRNELIKLRDTNEQLKMNLKNEEKCNETLRTQITQLTILNDERSMKVEQLSDEIKSVSRSLSLFKNNIKRLEYEKSRLINDINTLNKEKELWLENERCMKKQINDLKSEIDNNKQATAAAMAAAKTSTTTNVTMNYNEKYSPILLQLLQKIIKDKNEEINCLKQKVEFIESRLAQFLKEIRDKNVNSSSS